MEKVITIIPIIFGIYEVLSRVIPTTKTWSIIGNVVNILKTVSDALDKKRF